MIRNAMIFLSVIAAAALASYGLDNDALILWALGAFWVGIVIAAQLWPIEGKEKRRCENSDTLQGQVERTINFAETQLK